MKATIQIKAVIDEPTINSRQTMTEFVTQVVNEWVTWAPDEITDIETLSHTLVIQDG